MSSTIVSRGAGDLRANLVVGNFARLHGVSTWGTIRVGMRAVFRGGTSLAGTPLFGMGLCHNTSNIVMSPTCDHFLGWVTTGSSWTYNTYVNGGYWDNCNPKTMQMQNSATQTLVGSADTHFRNWATNAGTDATMLIFTDIVNGGGGSWTVKGYYSDNGLGAATPSASDFVTQMRLSTPTWSVNVQRTLSSAVTVDQATYGTLNAATVFWNRNSVTLDILDFGVVRLS